MLRKLSLLPVVMVLVLLCASPGARAQSGEAGPPARTAEGTEAPDATEPDAGMVTLNLPENVKLSALVDYVAKRKGINFLYEQQQLQNKQVTLKTPMRVPADSIVPLLGDVLQMKGLVLVKTGVDGMMRIANANTKLAGIAEGPGQTADAGHASDRNTAVTRIFDLKHTSPAQVQKIIQPFLSGSMAGITPLPGHDMLIVTDYASNMQRLRELMRVIDQPGRKVTTRFVKLQHARADEVQSKIEALVEGQASASGLEQNTSSLPVTVIGLERTNKIAVVGAVKKAAEAIEMVKALDVPLELTTEIYEFQVASPEDVDDLVQDTIGELRAEKFYKSATYEDRSLLIATTTTQIHEQIVDFKERLDQPIKDARSPMRFYNLENAKAADVLKTLQSIGQSGNLGETSVNGVSRESMDEGPAPRRGETQSGVQRQGQTDGEPGARADGAEDGAKTSNRVTVGDAKITAHEPTNTLIVIAQPSMQAVYKEMIEKLDKRRPQVLIEATVVSIDTTDDFQLGVEIFNEGSADGGTLLNFTKFGVTTDDSTPGAITLSPGTGFNGALLDADMAEIVVNAVQNDNRARVVSRPSVLMNDNATGELISEREEPFESVNASDTVATTSLGGFVTAGTNISITPQISEGSHLKLEYEISLSSFGEDRTDNLPPSRETDKLTSEATIPNGHTIVVGGLTSNSSTNSKSSVPLLGDIPILEYLVSNRSKTREQRTLFIFLRAVILREDKFKDLKILSTDALGRVDVADKFPDSEPVSME
jgi:type II secretory pathway component GspD/PulD (secretin)